MLFGLVASLGACTQSTEPADDATLRNAVTLDVQRVSRDSLRTVLRNTSDRVLTLRAGMILDTLPENAWQTAIRVMVGVPPDLPPRDSIVRVFRFTATYPSSFRVVYVVAPRGSQREIIVSRRLPD